MASQVKLKSQKDVRNGWFTGNHLGSQCESQQPYYKLPPQRFFSHSLGSFSKSQQFSCESLPILAVYLYQCCWFSKIWLCLSFSCNFLHRKSFLLSFLQFYWELEKRKDILVQVTWRNESWANLQLLNCDVCNCIA